MPGRRKNGKECVVRRKGGNERKRNSALPSGFEPTPLAFWASAPATTVLWESYRWYGDVMKNHFYEMKGDVGMSREKERRQEDAYKEWWSV